MLEEIIKNIEPQNDDVVEIEFDINIKKQMLLLVMSTVFSFSTLVLMILYIFNLL